jgi:hypothetical protein
MGERDPWDRRPWLERWGAADADEHQYPRTGQWYGYGGFDGMSPTPEYRTRYDPGAESVDHGPTPERQWFDWETDGADRHPLQLDGSGGDPGERGRPMRTTGSLQRRSLPVPAPHVGKGPRGWKRPDRRILEEVCHEMELNSELDPSDLEVACEDGEITLSGSVRTRRQKRLAGWIADGTYGVHDVHNRLVVREPGLRHGSARRARGEIATETTIEGTTRESQPRHIGALY